MNVNEMSEQELREYVQREEARKAQRTAAQKKYVQEHREERRAYTAKRNARIKALVEKARELGLDEA